MTTLISRSPIPLFIAWLLILEAGLPPVYAQPTEATPEEENQEQPELPPGSFIYLPNEQGRIVPVPLNAKLREFLEWRDSQTETPEDRLPEYSIDRLTLTGSANERLVNAEAVLAIRVRKKTGSVTVPLQFNEAILKEISHTGDGDYAFSGLKNTTGYEFKISGAGTHEIRLKLSVPITRTLASFRLQLTLPPTAVGSLELDVGLRDATFKAPARTAFEITPGGDRTAITLFGLTENLDLTWQPAPASRDARPVLQSNTSIETRMTNENVLLTASQKVSAVSGNFQQLEVRLPKGYGLERVKDKEDLLETYSAIEGRSGWYRLQLLSPTSDPITLEWTLSRSIPEPATALKIDGFELGGDVRTQSGEVRISELPGYRLQERDLGSLFRTDVLPPFSRAFEFYRQPFHLTLELQKIQPLYSLEPRFELQVERESLTWLADLELSVQRGAVSRISLLWPGWQAAGWQLPESKQTGLIAEITADENDLSILHIKFNEPQSGQNIKLSLRSEMRLAERDAIEGVELRLPYFPPLDVDGETELLVTAHPSLDVTLLESGNLETLPNLGSDANIVHRLRMPEYAQPQLKISAIPRERVVEINSNVTAELQEERNSVLVHQSLQYDVRFEGIETLRLTVPSSILASLSATDELGRPLPLEATEGTAEILIPVRIPLPETRTGPFAVEFEYEYELPDSVAVSQENASWILPLIQPGEAEAELSSLKLAASLSDQYEPDPQEWRQKDATSGERSYVAIGDAVRQEIGFLRRRSRASDVGLIVRHCLHVTWTDEDGLIHTRSDYLMNGSFETLSVQLPENYELDNGGIEFNDQPISSDAFSHSDRTLAVTPPQSTIPSDAVEYRLTIKIVSTQSASLTRMGTLMCESPELLNQENEQQKIQQTFWLVKLPYQQHLFFQPVGYTPQYLWQRQGLFWGRTPNKSIEQLSDWVQVSPGELEDLLTTGGNVYLFSRFGTGSRLTLGNMDRKVVVLIGAGLTLLISFMLLRLPATRNALSFLIIASALAFTGIWYPTSVALLLQPAILGFCLACLARTIDHLFRRPQLPTVVTFEDPTAGSSQVVGLTESPTPLSQLDLGLGSEDPTQMKHREMQEESMSSHISSGE